MDPEYLKQLTSSIINKDMDENAIDDETLTKYIDAAKALNPLGNVINSDQSYAALSITNWREEYIRKFTMTALIGYLYRLVDEYEPDDELEVIRNRMKGQPQEDIEREEKKMRTTYRKMVTKFLNRNFEYNPDKHLREAQSSAQDAERVSRDELIKQRMATQPLVDKIQGKIADSPDTTYQYIRECILQTAQTTNNIFNNTQHILKAMHDNSLDAEDKLAILTKNFVEIKRQREDINKVAAPLALADTLKAVQVSPPINVFHHFKRYSDNHFEQLRDIVQALYNEKPDIEFSVHYYNSFKSEEEAKRFRVQHEGEFKTSVFIVENTGVTLLGPFKQNRERVDFYNKNTEPIKRMMEQQEQDHKLGKDLMEKKVKDEKRKNVMKDGPDAAGLASYAKSIGVIRDLGSRKGLTLEEQEQLSKAKLEKEMAEVPDDAIQVDVFYPTTDETGEPTLKKTKFYTQAEAPLHLQKDSEFVDKYQPKRPDGVKLSETLDTKTITDKNGKTVQVTQIKESLKKLKE